MGELKQVDTPNAPLAVGAYSQAIRTDGLIFTSGCLPVDPVSKTMPDGIREQARTSLSNVRAVLEAGGGGMDRVVKCTVFLADIKDFQVVNEVYSEFFAKPFPARSCFAVGSLPLGAKVEIEAIGVAR
jgi:2-iminobutanoate/2-iminopropanoate deaminase